MVIEYAHQRFNTRNISKEHLPGVVSFQVTMVDHIQRKFSEQKLSENDNIFSLLAIASHYISTETKERCMHHKIGFKKLMSQLPRLIKRSTSTAVSTKQFFMLLEELEEQYNISVSEISNMDL